MLISNQNDKKTALAKFINYSFPLKKVNEYKKGIYGVIPKNKEQQFALNLLMDSKIPVVTLNGLAGSGKTLLCLAAGLEQTIEKNIYKRLVVIRPVMPLGRDIGFLPGSIQEKLEPYIMPIIDNLRFLFNNDRMMLDEYIKKDIIEIEAMTYIRGRSISDSFLLLDEAQNLTSHELKTVLTRIGENSKIVITGDLGQIDSPYLNETTSGLTNVIEKFKTQELSGHITLTKGERSLVATISSKIL
jgi:PhoH-like ATPase